MVLDNILGTDIFFRKKLICQLYCNINSQNPGLEKFLEQGWNDGKVHPLLPLMAVAIVYERAA